jgi:general nucleoside transport system permease protein
MLHQLLTANLWFLTLQAATPLLLVSLGVYLPLRAGVLNLGAEGVMLFGCFGAVLLEAKTGGSTALGVLGGAATGALVCTAFALLTVTLRANALVIGIALNFLASGATVTASTAIYGTAGTIATPNLAALPAWNIPTVSSIPWVGRVISGQTSLTYISIVIAVALAWALAHTRWGLTVRVTGSRPEIADAMRRAVSRTQWQTLVLGGALIGLGGAQLALAAAPQFTPDMTAGRGFIALALALIAGRHPIVLVPLAITFALFESLGINLQQFGLPAELSSAFPYVAIVLLLLAPKALQRFRAVGTPESTTATQPAAPAAAGGGGNPALDADVLSETATPR